MIRILVSLTVLLLAFPLAGAAGVIPPGGMAVVADDGNNLRAQGGPGYKDSKILHTLNKGVPVRVLRQEGAWSEVVVGQTQRGWINSKCLVPVAQYLSDPGNKADVYCPGDYARRFPAALDRDHAAAVVTLEDVPTLFGGGGRLVVKEATGAPLWRGPVGDMQAPPDKWDPLFYFCAADGVYWPSVIGDVDHDGFAEIMAANAQSDVSVSSFTMARWNGKAFAVVRDGESLVESPPDSGRFVWQKWGNANKDARWIMRLQKLDADGSILADIFEYGPKLPLRFGTARVRFDQNGATLLRWTIPLHAS
jgi:hypothetical protein